MNGHSCTLRYDRLCLAGLLVAASCAFAGCSSESHQAVAVDDASTIAATIAGGATASRAVWAEVARLSPADFAKFISSGLDNERFKVDGTIMEGAFDAFARTAPIWARADASYATVAQMLEQTHQTLSFAPTAATIRTMVAAARPELAIVNNWNSSPSATPALHTYSYYRTADCKTIKQAELYFYTDFPPGTGSYGDFITKQIRDQGNNFEPAPGQHLSADVISKQWQAVADRIDGCNNGSKELAANPISADDAFREISSEAFNEHENNL